MFIFDSGYERHIRSVLAEDGEVKIAVAFWGRGAEKLLKDRQGKKTKIICNLSSGGTNPEVIQKIKALNGVIIRQNDSLHAKILLGKTSAIIGSANISSNGLGLEGAEATGWKEAGLVTKEISELKHTNSWFMNLWHESREITEKNLASATEKWARRRSQRPFFSEDTHSGFDLRKISVTDTTDRRIFVAICRDNHLSNDAEAAYREYESKMCGSLKAKSEIPPMYESWEELPKDAQIIDVFWGPRGGISCDGVVVRTHEIEFTYVDGEYGHLAVCKWDSSLMGLKFGSKEAKQLAKTIKPLMSDIWECDESKGDQVGRYIPLSSLIKIVESHSTHRKIQHALTKKPSAQQADRCKNDKKYGF